MKISEETAQHLKKITAKPQNITPYMLFTIGNDYLGEYPEVTGCLFFNSHTNQAIAKELQRFKADSAFEHWMHLAKCYERLPNHRGQIAHLIRLFFITSFSNDTTLSATKKHIEGATSKHKPKEMGVFLATIAEKEFSQLEKNSVLNA